MPSFNSQSILIFLLCMLLTIHPIMNNGLSPQLNQQFNWPETLPLQINQVRTQITSKFSLSIHAPEYYTDITINSPKQKQTGQLLMHGDFGVLRLYPKNKPLVIYEAFNIRIIPLQHKIIPAFKNRDILQIQIIYQLTYGANTDYQTIGLSYFISSTQSQVSCKAKKFYNKIMSLLGQQIQNHPNITQSNTDKTFSIDKYFSLPDPKEPQNIYIYRMKQIPGFKSQLQNQWLWTLRRKQLKLSVNQFNKIKSIIGTSKQTNKQLTIVKNVYAAKIRAFKNQRVSKKQMPDAKQQKSSECRSTEQRQQQNIINDQL